MLIYTILVPDLSVFAHISIFSPIQTVKWKMKSSKIAQYFTVCWTDHCLFLLTVVTFLELQHPLQQKLKFHLLFKILKSCFNLILQDSVKMQTVLLNESRPTFCIVQNKIIITIF